MLRRGLWWPTAIVAGGILWLTLAPHPVGHVKVELFPGADKVVHALMMGTLTAAALFDWWRGPGRERGLNRRAVMTILLSVILFSVADEWAQGAMGLGRTSDPADLLADIAGILLAASLSLPLLRRRKKRDMQ